MPVGCGIIRYRFQHQRTSTNQAVFPDPDSLNSYCANPGCAPFTQMEMPGCRCARAQSAIRFYPCIMLQQAATAHQGEGGDCAIILNETSGHDQAPFTNLNIGMNPCRWVNNGRKCHFWSDTSDCGHYLLSQIRIPDSHNPRFQVLKFWLCQHRFTTQHRQAHTQTAGFLMWVNNTPNLNAWLCLEQGNHLSADISPPENNQRAEVRWCIPGCVGKQRNHKAKLPIKHGSFGYII